MRSERDVAGRFITAKATKNLNHEIFGSGSPVAAWLAGLIAADGCIYADHKRIGLAQSGDSGRQLIEEVRRLTNHRLKVSETKPPHGNVSPSITLASPQMISDLRTLYGITPRKTLTYTWPALDTSLIPVFLRGYVDGDGCVSTYPTPQGNPMLHLSVVGTPTFISGAMKTVPARGRHTVLTRCAALAEIRYNGRHAWQAALWLYADEGIYKSTKQQIFARYRDLLQREPPRWHQWARERSIVLDALNAGQSVSEVVASTGLPASRIYQLRSSNRAANTDASVARSSLP